MKRTRQAKLEDFGVAKIHKPSLVSNDWFLPNDISYRLVTQCLVLDKFCFKRIGLVCKLWHDFVLETNKDLVEPVLKAVALFPYKTFVPKGLNTNGLYECVGSAFVAAANAGNQITSVSERWAECCVSKFRTQSTEAMGDRYQKPHTPVRLVCLSSDSKTRLTQKYKTLVEPYGQYNDKLWDTFSNGFASPFLEIIRHRNASSLLAFHAPKHFVQPPSSEDSPTISERLAFPMCDAVIRSFPQRDIIRWYDAVFANHVSFPAILAFPLFMGHRVSEDLNLNPDSTHRLVYNHQEAMKYLLMHILGYGECVVNAHSSVTTKWSRDNLETLVKDQRFVTKPTKQEHLVKQRWERYKCFVQDNHTLIPQPGRFTKEHPCKLWSFWCSDCKADILVCCDCWQGTPDWWYKLGELWDDVWQCTYCWPQSAIRCQSCHFRHKKTITHSINKTLQKGDDAYGDILLSQILNLIKWEAALSKSETPDGES